MYPHTITARLAGWLLILACSVAAAAPIEESPAQLARFARLVRQQGYNCPVAKRLEAAPQDAYGYNFILYCAAHRTDTAAAWWGFRLVLPPAGGIEVSPL